MNDLTKITAPDRIYETPAKWGEVQFMNKKNAIETIEELKKIDGEWESINIDECDTYLLDHTAKDGTLVYRLCGVREDYYFKFCVELETGLYIAYEYEA